MPTPLTQDCRKFFILPQAFEGGGYYTYGAPGNGAFQYADPRMISLLLRVARDWCACDGRKFGIGNISLAHGFKSRDHKGHRNGRQVDIRPLRKDGKQGPCSILSADYDSDGTRKLIEIFVRSREVKRVLFNDRRIPNVKYWIGHDDHFHLEI